MLFQREAEINKIFAGKSLQEGVCIVCCVHIWVFALQDVVHDALLPGTQVAWK